MNNIDDDIMFDIEKAKKQRKAKGATTKYITNDVEKVDVLIFYLNKCFNPTRIKNIVYNVGFLYPLVCEEYETQYRAVFLPKRKNAKIEKEFESLLELANKTILNNFQKRSKEELMAEAESRIKFIIANSNNENKNEMTTKLNAITELNKLYGLYLNDYTAINDVLTLTQTIDIDNIHNALELQNKYINNLEKINNNDKDN